MGILKWQNCIYKVVTDWHTKITFNENQEKHFVQYYSVGLWTISKAHVTTNQATEVWLYTEDYTAYQKNEPTTTRWSSVRQSINNVGGQHRWLSDFLAACYELTLILCFSCFISLLFVASKLFFFFSSSWGQLCSCELVTSEYVLTITFALLRVKFFFVISGI